MTGRHPVRSGTYTVPWPGQGKAGMAPWEYTIAKLFSDSGYATALYGKWHLGNTQGRMPNDQGFDEWWGTPDTWDESGYTQWPLFKESGVPVPMLWEGKKGQKALFDSFHPFLILMHDLRAGRKRVLIHCMQGKDRSVAMAMALLIRYPNLDPLASIVNTHITKVDVVNALLAVQRNRPTANPSRAYMKKIDLFFIK